jgi:hypothetical protein
VSSVLLALPAALLTIAGVSLWAEIGGGTPTSCPAAPDTGYSGIHWLRNQNPHPAPLPAGIGVTC